MLVYWLVVDLFVRDFFRLSIVQCFDFEKRLCVGDLSDQSYENGTPLLLLAKSSQKVK